MEFADKPQATVKPLAIPVIVTLPREFDVTNAPHLFRELIAAFSPHATVVIADMSLTEFCDSSGICHLLIADDQAMAWGGELRVVVPSPGVLRVLNLTGVDRTLRIYPSLGEALSGKPSLAAGA